MSEVLYLSLTEESPLSFHSLRCVKMVKYSCKVQIIQAHIINPQQERRGQGRRDRL